MARALFPAQVLQNYSESKWSLADDNAQDETKPVAGDSITLTVNSGSVGVDEIWAAASLAATGASVWDFANQAGTVTGNITLDDITATWTGALLTAANLDIGANGSLTLAGTSTLNGNIEIDGGTFDMASNDLFVFGDFIYSSGTISNPGDLTMAGDGDISGPNSGNLLGTLTIAAGVTITRLVDPYMKALVVEAGAELAALAGGSTKEARVTPAAKDFLQVLGSVTGSRVQVSIGADDRSNSLDVSNVVLLDLRGDNAEYTWSGVLDVTALVVAGGNNSTVGTLLLAVDGYDLGAVILGDVAVATDRSGAINFASTTGSLTSLARSRIEDTADAADLSQANLTLSGTFDGDDMTVTAAGANVIGGTLTDVDSTGIVHSWGSTLSGTNSVDVTKESSLGGATANVGTGIGMAA